MGAGALALSGRVVTVHRDAQHRFAKLPQMFIRLVAGHGVEGDAHAGAMVQHRSRVARDPTQPNLRQVHLIHTELFAELATRGFAIEPGQIGENLTTVGLDLLALPTGALLRIGDAAVIAISGLRNPCAQLDRFRPGLMTAMLRREPDGTIARLAGVMGTVVAGGEVRPGDAIAVDLPSGVPVPLAVV